MGGFLDAFEELITSEHCPRQPRIRRHLLEIAGVVVFAVIVVLAALGLHLALAIGAGVAVAVVANVVTWRTACR